MMELTPPGLLAMFHLYIYMELSGLAHTINFCFMVTCVLCSQYSIQVFHWVFFLQQPNVLKIEQDQEFTAGRYICGVREREREGDKCSGSGISWTNGTTTSGDAYGHQIIVYENIQHLVTTSTVFPVFPVFPVLPLSISCVSSLDHSSDASCQRTL